MIPLTVLVLATMSSGLGLLVLALLFGLFTARRQARLWREVAQSDLLTGLPNRRGLEAHWIAMDGPKALILIDLVGFKAVNDSHGHIVGDALLRQVAGRLAAAVAPPGMLARWGGDEFVALVPADRLDTQQALIANAKLIAYDLSVSGGPAEVRIGARTGVSIGQASLEDAVLGAARELLNGKATA